MENPTTTPNHQHVPQSDDPRFHLIKELIDTVK